MFQRIKQLRTSDAVVHQIEELILGGVLRPGERLPAERDLATELDVSRPVLREAFKILEVRGLICSKRGGGTFIADVIGPIFSEPIVSLIERHPVATSDYLEYRRDMEATAAGHAAMRATPADHRNLRDIVARMQSAYEADDRQLEAELDIEFHQAVGEAAHNVILMHSLRSCYRLLENGVFFNRGRLYDHPTAREMVLKQHAFIADCIIAGDPDGARKASTDHIDYVRSAMAEAEQRAERGALADIRRQHRSQASETQPSERPVRRRKTSTSL
ncbi:FadR/GntR family transcriptional regulator [Roseibium sp.]|uniref:FadR/GntR family transcriptional regulator n=1 Tax=Roseibium sp. TaxID=1936156 RepID=UPI003A983094